MPLLPYLGSDEPEPDEIDDEEEDDDDDESEDLDD